MGTLEGFPCPPAKDSAGPSPAPSTRLMSALVGLFALAALLPATERAARAQPMFGGGAPGGGRGMPDLRMMNGKPLPDPGLAAGTVTVRVARKMPVNAVAGAEVTALVTNAGGESKKRTATTDSSGRAIFEAVGAGNQFQAEVRVDGETIKSSTFAVPPTGGVRTMLIAGLGPAPAQGDDESGEGPAGGGASGAENFLGAPTAAAMPAPDLPAKTLEVHALDENGHPLPNLSVQLGTAAPGGDGKLKVTRATTNADGLARFTELATGNTVGYAAVVDYHGIRLGTQPFTMPEAGGMRAEIRALQHTNDPSIISLGSGGRIVLQMHDEFLQITEMLQIENHTEKLFDPGPGGIEIPLPRGFVSAEVGEADRARLEIRKNYGIAVHGPIPPTRGPTGANSETTFAFVVPYHGATHDYQQVMPNGLGETVLIIEQAGNLSVEGPGIGARQARELNGHKYWVMPMVAIAPGQKLAFLVTGLPSTDNSGRIASATLALLLVVASALFARKPAGGRSPTAVADRDRLMERRETLFQQLVETERERRTQAAGPGEAAKDRRNQLVAKLESVYRDLAALDEPRAP